MDNHTYNLINALSEKAEALEVYQKYTKDAESCGKCASLWQNLIEDEKEEIKEMKDILISHVQEGVIK